MDQKTKEKIEEYQGLDFCEHGKIRMYCPFCGWDVPTYMRKRREKFLKEKAKKEKVLTNSFNSDIKK